MAEQVDDARLVIIRARAQSWIATTLSAMGRHREAMPANYEAQVLFRQAVAHDPDNVEWAMEYYWHQHQLARDQIWVNRLEEAAESLRVIRDALGGAPADDADGETVRLYGALSTEYAYLHLLSGDPDAALAEARQALSLLDPWVRDADDARVLLTYSEAAYLVSETASSAETARHGLELLEEQGGDTHEMRFRKFALAVNAGDETLAERYRGMLSDSEFVAPMVPGSRVEARWHASTMGSER